MPELGILENGGIKIRRLLSVIIEPQAWDNFLHRFHSVLRF
jgi:hypothetical protein